MVVMVVMVQVEHGVGDPGRWSRVVMVDGSSGSGDG